MMRDTLLDVRNKEQPLWRAAVVAKVHELAAMPEGWDGRHGSRRIQPASSANMLRILHAIAKMDLPSPHISPISGSALQIGWSLKNRDLEIVTYADGSINYLQTGSANVGDMQDGVLLAGDAVLRGLLDWLLGSKEPACMTGESGSL